MAADLAIILAATLGAGCLRGLTGFGFALAAVPVYSLILSPLEAVAIALLLQIGAAPLDLWQSRHHVDRQALWRLCAGALIGAPPGALLAVHLPPDLMRVVIALFVLAGLAALLARLTIRGGRGPALAAGALAGFLAGLAAMPGPPAVAYFLGRGGEKAVIRASLLMFFAFSATVSLLAMALGSGKLGGAVLVFAALAYPAMLLGGMAGAALFRRLPEGSYRHAAIAVLLVSALVTGARGLAGLWGG